VDEHFHLTLDDVSGGHHAVLAALREQGPVAWVADIDGWVVTTRELAIAVMRDPTTYTVDDPRFSTAQVIGPSMLSLDGEAHSRHRNPFADAYRPAAVIARYTDTIVATAGSLVADLAPHGSAELRRQLAGPLAVAVVALSLGLESIDTVDLLGWYDRIVAGVERVSAGEPVDPGAVDAFDQLSNALRSAVARPDSVLHEAAAHLDADELVSNAAVFLFGGIETSEGMTANLLAHLLTNPDQLDAVRNDRGLVEAAVEESLRLEPAAARVDRYAARDVEVGGQLIRRGDMVVVSLAAANRDPSVYPDPDCFDVRRSNARTHVAFAQGPHACIGAQLARMETRAALNAVLDLLPGIELTESVDTQGVVFRKPLTVRARWKR